MANNAIVTTVEVDGPIVSVVGDTAICVEVLPNVTINNNAVSEIDDENISQDSTYSSFKIEDRIEEEIGDDDFNFVLLFENQLSQ